MLITPQWVLTGEGFRSRGGRYSSTDRRRPGLQNASLHSNIALASSAVVAPKQPSRSQSTCAYNLTRPRAVASSVFPKVTETRRLTGGTRGRR